MAYLAKECLLLDPDDRPTMSEVVQILSTIAPEKSRRRNLPVNFYQVINLCHYFLGTFDFLITGFSCFSGRYFTNDYRTTTGKPS